MLCVCITGYLDEEKQEIRVTKKKRWCQKEGFPKSRSGLGEKTGGPRGEGEDPGWKKDPGNGGRYWR